MTVHLAVEADEALRLAQARPAEALPLASELAGRALAAGDLAAASVAERALGLVALHTQNLPDAVAHFLQAVRLAERGAAGTVAARARISLSYALAATGATRRALHEADLAARHLTGFDSVRLEVQRALILTQLGRLDEGLAIYRQTLPVVRRHRDVLLEVRLLCNRGILYSYRGEYQLAEADLRKATVLSDQAGQDLMGTFIRGNLGYVAACRGDVIAALRWYDEAEAQRRALGATAAHLLQDRARLLLAVRLIPEGRRAAEAALAEWQRQGDAASAAEAKLLLAEAALLDGQPGTAYALAEEARASFARQRRAAWQALARHVALQASLADPAGAVSIGRARRVANELERAGWRAGAADVRLFLATLHLSSGKVRQARTDLERDRLSRRQGPIGLQARAWHAEALLRLATGRRRTAASAVARGLRLIEGYRATLGVDLSISFAAHRTELANLGLRMALEDRHPRRILQWVERGRASHLMFPPVRPTSDDDLTADLAALRGVVVAVDEALRAGESIRELSRRQAQLEARIRRGSLSTPRSGDISAVVPVGELAVTLKDWALVEYVIVDGQLLALTLVNRRCRLHELGAADDVVREVRYLDDGLQRQARARPRDASRAGASARLAAQRLQERLVTPLLRVLDDRPLVVAPSGALQLLPWSVLPSLRSRPLCVTPSASVWHLAEQRAAGAGSVLAAAGPKLPGAAEEAAAVAALYPRAELRTGEQATVEQVLGAIGGVDVVHLAAHGHPRADNPLFSHLRMVDGPLTAYDLERTPGMASLAVVSACDAGRTVERQGNEVFGLATAFLARRCRTLIGPLLCVPDVETVPHMVALHEQLRSGRSPAEAMMQARLAGAPSLEDPRSSVDLFACLGAG
jgi:CHAT domain-containing protein/tetratricopeptide (TPR) repeat protein